MSKIEHENNVEVALKHRLPPEERVNFDRVMRICSLFTGVTDSESDFQMTDRYRNYRYIIVVFLYSNILRTTIECFLPEGSNWFLYLGDFKPWWGKPYIAHQIVFFMAVLVVPAICTLNMTADESMKRWCPLFKYIEGLIPAEDIKLWNVVYIRKLRSKMRFNYNKAFIASVSVHIPYTISVFITFYLNCKTWYELFVFGVPWTLYESLWTVYITTNNYGILPGAFEVICYYLRLRYQQIHELIAEVRRDIRNSPPNNWMLLRVRIKLDRLLKELHDINNNIIDYNHYWSKFIAIIFISYIPQILFEFYIFLFLPMNSSVLTFSLLLNLNIFALIAQLSLFSSALHQKANKVYTELNSTFVQISRTFEDSKITGFRVIRLKQKVSMFIERYSSRLPLGIYVWDIILIDFEFFFKLLIQGLLYFLLVVSLLQYS